MIRNNPNEIEKLNYYAINPINGQEIPIFVNNDYSQFGSLNAHGIPHLDSRIGKLKSKTIFLPNLFCKYLVFLRLYKVIFVFN